jgi:hypothetical protein
MKTESIEQLNEIRNLMERSSRFISLSGLSGVVAGLLALAGSIFAFLYLNYDLRYFNPDEFFGAQRIILSKIGLFVLSADAFVVLVSAIASAIYFTTRKAKRAGQKVWSLATRQLLINVFLPLVTGGAFCIILLYYGLIFLIAPATLIFYGLALINASKYTLGEIRGLGICEVIIGLLAAVFAGYGLIFWAFGFGVLHIVYGLLMYRRYELNK